MQNVQFNYEIADGYIYRFLVLFKPFFNLELTCTSTIYENLESCALFKERFEAEFGSIHKISGHQMRQLLWDFNQVLYDIAPINKLLSLRTPATSFGHTPLQRTTCAQHSACGTVARKSTSSVCGNDTKLIFIRWLGLGLPVLKSTTTMSEEKV
jgi:hypothetical protein